MKLKAWILFFLLFVSVSKSWSVGKTQSIQEKKVELLLKQADDLKYQDDHSGLQKVNEAEKIAKRLETDEKLGEVYTLYSIYFYIAGTYDKALQMSLKAISIHEKYDNEAFITRSLNVIGLVQSAFNQLEESIATFRKCIILDSKIKNHNGIARSYFNISIAQIELKQYDAATKSLRKSLEFSKKDDFRLTNHMVENRLGDMMLVRNEIDSAFYYYNSVINSKIQKPSNWESAYSYGGLANTYVKLKDYKNAEKNGLIALDFAKKLNAKWDLAQITKILSNIYAKQNNNQKAYEFLLHSSILNDSLYNERKLNDVVYLQLKSKEVENLKLISKNEINAQKAKRDRIIIYSFSVLILFLIGFLILFKRTARLKDVFNVALNVKNKDIENQKLLISDQNKELISLNETKNQLFSIVAHDLRSPIANIVQMLELQKDNSFSPELQEEIFDQLSVQTQVTSTMLNNLLQWANTQIDGQTVNLEKLDLNQIVTEALQLYAVEMKKKSVSYETTIETKEQFINADKGQVRVILHNILANAIKFTAENGSISFGFTENADFIVLHIYNFGNTIEQARLNEILNSSKRINSELGTSSEEGTGLGLLLVKQFLANNKGMLDIKSDAVNGTEFIISFMKI